MTDDEWMDGCMDILWCASVSLPWLLLLWNTGSRHSGLVAPWHVESSQTRDRTCVLCIGRWILIHCTTKEVPHLCFSKKE